MDRFLLECGDVAVENSEDTNYPGASPNQQLEIKCKNHFAIIGKCIIRASLWVLKSDANRFWA